MSYPILVQLFCTFALTGLILTIQLVHYPAFSFVQEQKFIQFHQFHSQRITWIVMPLMLGELASAGYLWWEKPSTFWAANFLLAGMPWILTFALSVPAHNILGAGFEANAARWLVSSNWARTAVWLAHSALLLWFLRRS